MVLRAQFLLRIEVQQQNSDSKNLFTPTVRGYEQFSRPAGGKISRRPKSEHDELIAAVGCLYTLVVKCLSKAGLMVFL